MVIRRSGSGCGGVVGSLTGIKDGGLPDSRSKAAAMLEAILKSVPYKHRTEQAKDARHKLMKALIKLNSRRARRTNSARGPARSPWST
jgi:hypothetical protein